MNPTTQKNLNGSYAVYDLVNGRLKHCTYYGYTEAQAVRKFRKMVKSGESIIEERTWGWENECYIPY